MNSHESKQTTSKKPHAKTHETTAFEKKKLDQTATFDNSVRAQYDFGRIPIFDQSENHLAPSLNKISDSNESPASVFQTINRKGESIQPKMRSYLESRFQHNFSQVRLHTDQQAIQSAKELDALAYTVGHHIVLDDHALPPQSYARQKALAHELAHVVQQSPLWSSESLTLSEKPGLEAQASDAAQQVMRGQSSTVGHTSTAGIMRLPRSLGRSIDPANWSAEEVEQEIEEIDRYLELNAPSADDIDHLNRIRQSLVVVRERDTSPEPERGAEAAIPSSRIIEVILISSHDSYRPPGSSITHQVGDAAATRLLMDIQERGSHFFYRVFNFETGIAAEVLPIDWNFFLFAAGIGGQNEGIRQIGRNLSTRRLRSLWPDPLPEILRMYEEGGLSLEPDAIMSGYRGMIRVDATRSLNENEEAIDELLGASDRIERIREYAEGLREASIVRDALIERRDEISRRLVAQHSFRFGPPIRGTGPNMVQRLRFTSERENVEDTLDYWLNAFPLLTRLETQEISPESVESRLREIKDNIVSTREQLDRGRLDPMSLDVVRARVTPQVGPRAQEVIEEEESSARAWAIAGGIVGAVAMVAILFLPGGLFIDAAIGVALAGHAIAHAAGLSRIANTGMHVDDGLVSQAQAQEARLSAVLATILAVLGTVASGFRVIRFGLALRNLGRSMPGLSITQRGAIARAMAHDPALMRAFTRISPEDTFIGRRVAAAVEQAAGNPRALRAALDDLARIIDIPRRVPSGTDLYTPLRQITDGSDIEQIARLTGLSRAEVEAAKRHLMFDEHLLLDNMTEVLYRGRFDPWDDIADVWGRTARGEPLNASDRNFLRRLIRHEHLEGSILSTSSRTLEQAFLYGGLEGPLRTALRSAGWSRQAIDSLIASESTPITPYRFAHLVAHARGAPNP